MSVGARPSVRDVPRSIHRCELESLFPFSVALNAVKRSTDGEKRGQNKREVGLGFVSLRTVTSYGRKSFIFTYLNLSRPV